MGESTEKPVEKEKKEEKSKKEKKKEVKPKEGKEAEATKHSPDEPTVDVMSGRCVPKEVKVPVDPDELEGKSMKPPREKGGKRISDPDENAIEAPKEADPRSLLKKKSSEEYRKGSGSKKHHDRLEAGQFFATERRQYFVEEVIKRGMFGNLCKLSVLDTKEEFAIKSHKRDLEKKWKFALKGEMDVLRAANADKNCLKRGCFVKMIECGRCEQFGWVITTLVSHNLKDIFSVLCKSQMPINSAAYLTRQTFNAVTALHGIGFLHGDIKPRCFAIGLPPRQRQVFILDFANSRKLSEQKTVRHPRTWPMVSSLKYCSRRWLQQQDRSRKDDYESWAYMCLELFYYGNLVWRNMEDTEKVLKWKMNVFASLDKTYLMAPPAFILILKEIDAMNNAVNVQEQWKNIDAHLTTMMIVTGIDDNVGRMQFVWETEVMPSKEERKKEKIEEKRKKLEGELLKVMEELDEVNKHKKPENKRAPRAEKKEEGAAGGEIAGDDRGESRMNKKKGKDKDDKTDGKEKKRAKKTRNAPTPKRSSEEKKMKEPKRSSEELKDKEREKSPEKGVTPEKVDIVDEDKKSKHISKDGHLTNLAVSAEPHSFTQQEGGTTFHI